MRAASLVAILFVLGLYPAFAQDQSDPEQSCEGNSTPEIVDCLKAQTAQWDKRLNAAYQQALKDAEGKQREQLRAAQRLWVQYRDANCLYYALAEGTIVRVEAGYCMLELTKARVTDFESKTEKH